jgi:Na+-transporting NADH:ubiquinone oxidoreductase subunit C
VKGNSYTLYYAAVLGTVCALLLTAAAKFTEPYRIANQEAEEMKNILVALKVPVPDGASPEQLVDVFEENVRDEYGDKAVYVYSPNDAGGKVEAIALRFAGPGLWGPIKGFLALESDRKTIRGITFYEQEETPGLGGDIVLPSFRVRFEKKSIVDETGKPGIVIRIGGGELPNGVDSISGATMTCDKVKAMLNKVIERLIEGNSKDGQ